MDSQERFARVSRLFQAAIARPREEQEAFVTNHPDAGGGVDEEVLRLLAADRSSQLTEQLPKPVGDLAKSSGTPDRLGPYRIGRRLGEGGMGVVHEGL